MVLRHCHLSKIHVATFPSVWQPTVTLGSFYFLNMAMLSYHHQDCFPCKFMPVCFSWLNKSLFFKSQLKCNFLATALSEIGDYFSKGKIGGIVWCGVIETSNSTVRLEVSLAFVYLLTCFLPLQNQSYDSSKSLDSPSFHDSTNMTPFSVDKNLRHFLHIIANLVSQ